MHGPEAGSLIAETIGGACPGWVSMFSPIIFQLAPGGYIHAQNCAPLQRISDPGSEPRAPVSSMAYVDSDPTGLRKNHTPGLPPAALIEDGTFHSIEKAPRHRATEPGADFRETP